MSHAGPERPGAAATRPAPRIGPYPRVRALRGSARRVARMRRHLGRLTLAALGPHRTHTPLSHRQVRYSTAVPPAQATPHFVINAADAAKHGLLVTKGPDANPWGPLRSAMAVPPPYLGHDYYDYDRERQNAALSRDAACACRAHRRATAPARQEEPVPQTATDDPQNPAPAVILPEVGRPLPEPRATADGRSAAYRKASDPVLFADVVDIGALAQELAAGVVTCTGHPDLPLAVYTYAHGCWRWNPVTIRCRGLVVDQHTGLIVGWAMPKFFMAATHERGFPFAPPLPDEPFELYTKADGSLGTVFFYAGAWHAASKSSFTSPQARWAQAWLDERRDQLALFLDPDLTYTVEIVYPDNHLIVDNGPTSTLILTAVHLRNGDESRIGNHHTEWNAIGGSLAPCLGSVPPTPFQAHTIPGAEPGHNPLQPLIELAENNTGLDGRQVAGHRQEGWVVRFASGTRAKIKFRAYRDLVEAAATYSAIDVWRAFALTSLSPQLDARHVAVALGTTPEHVEAMRATRALGRLLGSVPEQFADRALDFTQTLAESFEDLHAEHMSQFQRINAHCGTRTEFAHEVTRAALDNTARNAMFAAYQSQDRLALYIWRTLRPATKPLLRTNEEA